MKKLIAVLLMLPLACFAQKSPFSYGTNGMGSVLSADQVIISRSGTAGPFYNPTMTQLGAWVASQISGSCTATAALVLTCSGGGGGGASTFDQLGTGTNVTATMTCSTGCLVTGNVNANQINSLAVPANCAIAYTNASMQFGCLTVTGCGLGVSNAQIFTAACLSSFTNLPTCNAAAQGQQYTQTDPAVFPPTRGTVAVGGGAGNSSWNVVCQDSSGTYNWYYL
jgi:hypothetical protein